jgi:hypothetical protein
MMRQGHGEFFTPPPHGKFIALQASLPGLHSEVIAFLAIETPVFIAVLEVL